MMDGASNGKQKKVLVTGADGFIGSHLVEKLLNEGYHVKAFCIYNSNGSWGWLDLLEEQVKNKYRSCAWRYKGSTKCT